MLPYITLTICCEQRALHITVSIGVDAGDQICADAGQRILVVGICLKQCTVLECRFADVHPHRYGVASRLDVG